MVLKTHARLVLSGGGNAEQSYAVDKHFVNMLDSHKPLLYIPIAMEEERHPYPECYQWIKDALTQHGRSNIKMWTEHDLTNKKTSDLEQFAGVYVGGGNTYKLLHLMRKTKFLPILREAVEHGMPYYGGSAGAILAGVGIETSGDPNITSLGTYSTMGLVGEYHISCHLNPQRETLLRAIAREQRLRIIAIPEGAAVVLDHDALRVIATQPCEVKLITQSYNKSFKPGEKLPF